MSLNAQFVDHGDDIRIGFDKEVFLDLDAIDIVLFDIFSLDFFSESVIFAPSQSANSFTIACTRKDPGPDVLSSSLRILKAVLLDRPKVSMTSSTVKMI